jgi:hypothetical protein
MIDPVLLISVYSILFPPIPMYSLRAPDYLSFVYLIIESVLYTLLAGASDGPTHSSSSSCSLKDNNYTHLEYLRAYSNPKPGDVLWNNLDFAMLSPALP